MARHVQNFEALATTKLRTDALLIAEAGYSAINTRSALARKLRLMDDVLTVDDKEYSIRNRRIFFVGVGKCAAVAATAIEQILGDRLTGGIALDVSEPEEALKKIAVYVGTHPLPSAENEHATKKILDFLSECTEDDLVIALISGGGSTLLSLNNPPMTVDDERDLFRQLTAHGAPIQEINTVRKHISRARGGGLAAAAYPAEVVSLIISDVPGNEIEFIASGPTILDTSTIADAANILAKYGITQSENIILSETPKEQKYFDRVTNTLFLTNADALVAMKKESENLGYIATIVDDHFIGEARDIGSAITENLHASPAGTALFYAGESTVTAVGSAGKGGRNQELILSALSDIRDGEIVISFASDGHDNSDHAGAIADSLTLEHAEANGISASEHLATHNSYDFFKLSGDALMTGYTGSNVSDIIIAIKK